MAELSWNIQSRGAAIWPETLKPGDTLGLFAPAHHFDRREMEQGLALLESWGLKVRVPKGLFKRDRYLAGSDAQRLEVLAELMEDDSIQGLMAVRGGYGCQRLLPALSGLWAGWPAKPIFGFSDLTALHLARFKASGVIGYHSPMVVSLGKSEKKDRADSLSQADLKKFLFEGDRSGRWEFSGRQALKKGRAKGPILGGNLTLVAALLSGPWLPDFKNAILMLEDVDEPPYSLDRLLVTLRHSPVWRQASGLVFGAFSRSGTPAEISRLLKEAAADFDGPVVFGAPFSHLRRNRVFPVGAVGLLSA
ncbi:LD-carboxypeptidase [Deltaproteobacteria bacterium OttesenSCG-928-K17]|nr:LD-carboxypeptidase [Deltaproteobacteria bacterium OttesenSCG-928-K17]